MEVIKKLFIIILCLSNAVVFTSGVNSSQPDNKIIRKADNLFLFGDYKNALPIYEKLAAASPENKQFNYRLGVCYYYSGTDILKCLPYFEKAKQMFTEENEETIDLYYYLGTTYHMINRFDDAIGYYTKIRASILPDKQGLEDIRDMDNQIAACIRGKELIQHPVSVIISDLGVNVNSEYADYAPVITNDQSTLIFTSKRKESTGGRIDEDGNYYEDVFISKRMNAGDWQSSQRLDTGNIKRSFFSFSKSKILGNSINTREHDASVALSPDGKQLFIYRLDDVWVSDYKDNKWNKPSKLSNFISSKKSHEPSVSMSMDEKTLYFVSERKGGYGGKDIYKSEKQADGTWGEPKNLGPVINSEYDEDAPYIDSQSGTLYFSSEAHGSIGGFDVFKSTLNDSTWSTPENLGYPVNSGANDIFFNYNSKEKTAYFSSIREGGNGNYDIYLADFNPPKEPDLFVKTPFAVLQNNKLKNDPTPVEILNANGKPDTLLLTNNNNITVYKPGETYSIAITSPSSGQKHVTEFTVPKNAATTPYYQQISFDEITDAKGKITGYKTSLYNAHFDLDSAISNTEFAKITDKALAYSAYLKATRNTNNPSLQVFEYDDKITVNSSSIVAKTNTEPGIVEIKLNPVLFGFAQDKISPEFIPELEKAYGYMISDKASVLKVTGYADSKGDAYYNMLLSLKRAATVRTYFVDKGIAASRIKSSGKGETDPVAPETNPDGTDNPEGRKLNRRVELSIEKK